MLALWVGLFGFSLLISEYYAKEEKEFNLKFHQNDYNLTIEWAEVARFNKRCFKQFELATFKFNRTCTAFNLTFTSNFDMNKNLEVIVQVYKFLSNEYRLFPIRFEVNFCTALSKNLIGASRAFECGNFTGCQILKDKGNHICNFTPDPSQFPPFVPSGRYKIEVQGWLHNEEVFAVDGYVEAYRAFAGK